MGRTKVAAHTCKHNPSGIFSHVPSCFSAVFDIDIDIERKLSLVTQAIEVEQSHLGVRIHDSSFLIKALLRMTYTHNQP